jgi:RimJ/RimL family protein N-acetyltransferase
VIGLLGRWSGRSSPSQLVPDLNVPKLRGQGGRLRLVAITPEMLAAEPDADKRELARLLNARVTTEWPPEHWEPHVLRFILKQYEDRPDTQGWHRYVLLTRWLGRERTLVGALGGFPKPGGDVEIGYSTLSEFQRRGYATAAARVMVEWLLGREGVRSVSAQTYPRLPESIKVMERCGMTFVGEGDDPGTVRYRRMR